MDVWLIIKIVVVVIQFICLGITFYYSYQADKSYKQTINRIKTHYKEFGEQLYNEHKM
jgi:ABC-type cobalt transport system substrate-binding protein